MIPIPRSQRLTMIASERTTSAERYRVSDMDFLIGDDYERDPYVYNHLNTELSAEA